MFVAGWLLVATFDRPDEPDGMGDAPAGGAVALLPETDRGLVETGGIYYVKA